MMTSRDPYVNVMRGAMAAFSAGLGGADSVSVLPHTLAVGLPDSLSRRLARNGQLILLRESHLGFVADPAAGAGGFRGADQGALRQRVDALPGDGEEGGLAETLARGAFQLQVAESASRLRRNVARLKAPITGVSAHADLAETPVELAPGAPEREHAPASEGALAPMRLAEPFEALARSIRRHSRSVRRAAEGPARRARSRARASPPRRLHARMAGGGRDRAGLRRRGGNADSGDQAAEGERRIVSRASAATTRPMRPVAKRSPPRSRQPASRA